MVWSVRISQNAVKKSVSSELSKLNLGKDDWNGDIHIINANLKAILYLECCSTTHSKFDF